jgi:hypothetical protein
MVVDPFRAASLRMLIRATELGMEYSRERSGACATASGKMARDGNVSIRHQNGIKIEIAGIFWAFVSLG